MVISITFYDDENPVIRISTESRETLREIRMVFEEMSTGKFQEFNLSDIPDVQFSGLNTLILRFIEGDTNPRKTLKRVNDNFYWSQTADGWDESLLWLDGILESDTPGHQYFTDEKSDDALIVIACAEGY